LQNRSLAIQKPQLPDDPSDEGPSKAKGKRRSIELIKRTLSVAATLFGLMALTFFMGRLLPADPVLAVTGPDVSQAVYDRVYAELGLDNPIWLQFFYYVANVLRGDLGLSNATGRPVITELLQVFPATIELALIASFFGVGLGVPLGVAAAVYRGKLIDHVARLIALLGSSVPSFWLGLMALMLFYAKLRWVGGTGRIGIYYEGIVEPITGMLLLDSLLRQEWDVFFNAINHIFLPAALLGYFSVAYISRMTRSFMLDQLSQEYVITARAKGLSNASVIWRHAFKNIRVQLLTIVALTFGGLLDGAVLIETVFSWPGLGGFLTRGLQLNDMNVVMGAVLLIGVVYLTINAVSDVLYRVLDPRTRG
jgi:peptide/nickel transport system permease protein